MADVHPRAREREEEGRGRWNGFLARGGRSAHIMAGFYVDEPTILEL